MGQRCLGVSILVLLDVALKGSAQYRCPVDISQVSILVLLDVALKGGDRIGSCPASSSVSILVLLDVALKDTAEYGSVVGAVFQSLFSWMLL